MSPWHRKEIPLRFARVFLTTAWLFLACGTVRDESGWIKHPDNPVLRPGRKTGETVNDYYNLSDCFVVKEGGVFKAWYTSSGPTAASGANHCNISYAESKDGIAWTKHPGNPVFDIDPSSWDRYAIETVSVLIDPDGPPDEKYRMWYCGRTSDAAGSPGYDIGYAYSGDGIAWTRHGTPVLARGSSADWDNYFIEGPTVLKDGSHYLMWYAGMDAVADGQATDGKVCIGLAVSDDGILWTKHPSNPVVTVGTSGSWDDRTVQDPHVLRYDGAYRMWYGGKNGKYEHYGQQTGYAESTDGVIWRKSPNNPSLKRGDSGSWDSVTASFGSVLIDGGKAKIWYTGMDEDYPDALPDYWEIGYAEKLLVDGALAE